MIDIYNHIRCITILPDQQIDTYESLVSQLQAKHADQTTDQQRYLLVQLPMEQLPHYIQQLFYQIQLAEVIPIIAQPERNQYFIKQPNQLYQLVKKGALAQLTAEGILGKWGKTVEQFCYTCLEHDWCHVLAGATNQTSRSEKQQKVLLEKSYKHVSNRYGKLLVQELQDNAEKISRGEGIYVDPPRKLEEKRGLLKQLLGSKRR